MGGLHSMGPDILTLEIFNCAASHATHEFLSVVLFFKQKDDFTELGVVRIFSNYKNLEQMPPSLVDWAINAVLGKRAFESYITTQGGWVDLARLDNARGWIIDAPTRFQTYNFNSQITVSFMTELIDGSKNHRGELYCIDTLELHKLLENIGIVFQDDHADWTQEIWAP
jgi:hypothetical protein